MSSVNIIYLGAILSAIGSFMVIYGNVQHTKEIDQRQSAQLRSSIENVVSHFKTISKDQIELITRDSIEKEKVSLIINDLTLPERWVLLRFINGYQRLKKGDMQRMFAELNDYYSKFSFNNREDPFDILSRKKLIKSKNASTELTALGLKIVTLMVKNKISPFDIIKEY